MKKKLTQQLKEPEGKIEGIEFRVEDSDGSDVVISSQLKVENRGKKRRSHSRYAKKKFQDLVEESRFNLKYFENRITLKKAKHLARYNEAMFQGAYGV